MKDDSTGMSTVVGTDSLAFAKCKLGARDWTSEFTPGSDQCSTPTSILPMAQLLDGRALELASEGGVVLPEEPPHGLNLSLPTCEKKIETISTPKWLWRPNRCKSTI